MMRRDLSAAGRSLTSHVVRLGRCYASVSRGPNWRHVDIIGQVILRNEGLLTAIDIVGIMLTAMTSLAAERHGAGSRDLADIRATVQNGNALGTGSSNDTLDAIRHTLARYGSTDPCADRCECQLAS